MSTGGVLRRVVFGRLHMRQKSERALWSKDEEEELLYKLRLLSICHD